MLAEMFSVLGAAYFAWRIVRGVWRVAHGREFPWLYLSALLTGVFLTGVSMLYFQDGTDVKQILMFAPGFFLLLPAVLASIILSPLPLPQDFGYVFIPLSFILVALWWWFLAHLDTYLDYI